MTVLHFSFIFLLVGLPFYFPVCYNSEWYTNSMSICPYTLPFQTPQGPRSRGTL